MQYVLARDTVAWIIIRVKKLPLPEDAYQGHSGCKSGSILSHNRDLTGVLVGLEKRSPSLSLLIVSSKFPRCRLQATQIICHSPDQQCRSITKTEVRDVMTPGVVYCLETQEAEEAAKMMQKHQTGAFLSSSREFSLYLARLFLEMGHNLGRERLDALVIHFPGRREHQVVDSGGF